VVADIIMIEAPGWGFSISRVGQVVGDSEGVGEEKGGEEEGGEEA
jgi:hypothetical protein